MTETKRVSIEFVEGEYIIIVSPYPRESKKGLKVKVYRDGSPVYNETPENDGNYHYSFFSSVTKVRVDVYDGTDDIELCSYQIENGKGKFLNDTDISPIHIE